MRDLYVELGNCAIAAVRRDAVRDQWDAPSALDGFTIGELAAHLTRAILQVDSFLQDPPPEVHGELVWAERYYGMLTDLAIPNSEMNLGVVQRAKETAAPGWSGVVSQVEESMMRLQVTLAREASDRVLSVFGALPMLLDEYLKTRFVEMVVHLDDLEVSLGGGEIAIPAGAVAVARDVIVGVAEDRIGSLGLIRAMVRTDRVGAVFPLF